MTSLAKTKTQAALPPDLTKIGSTQKSGAWKKTLSGLTGLVGLVIFLALWEAAPRLGWLSSTYLSPPDAVFRAIFHLGETGEL